MYKKKGKLTITEIWDTEIVISDKKDYTEETLDMILLHEMIHAYFGIIESRDVGHNIEFKVKAKEISNTVGFEVPLTDNVTEISSAIKAKKVGCILFEFGSRTNVMFASENTYNKHIAKFLIDTLPKYSFPADLKITHGMCETNLTAVYPLVRSFNKVKLYRLEEQNEDKIKWLEAKEFYFGDEYNR
ncbi:hypothetical protein HYO65_gp065 [Tenacibaculum phage PTm1]|uniref:SprT-like domain-containing protein n=2 Tax=Shirahamavirus PTm1 TaxID=2846435 RepID=A0A5S9HXP7_9CAUD|nr:hypothetical protein HYO65_gp065 [Tenacibaculum phage PTm1]BBI90457.1 hypothetical protein [Tenacibaculum phage PTm1]BBI90765.1 hypothetical protein [Tenacibaculum phage PTm5]